MSLAAGADLGVIIGSILLAAIVYVAGPAVQAKLSRKPPDPPGAGSPTSPTSGAPVPTPPAQILAAADAGRALLDGALLDLQRRVTALDGRQNSTDDRLVRHDQRLDEHTASLRDLWQITPDRRRRQP